MNANASNSSRSSSASASGTPVKDVERRQLDAESKETGYSEHEEDEEEEKEGEDIEKQLEQSDSESGHEEESSQEDELGEDEELSAAPPLPDEDVPPPLPNEAPPSRQTEDNINDDGWEPVWDANTQAYYFYNRFTGVSQWENPRIPTATGGGGGEEATTTTTQRSSPAVGGYNPAIHGDYDPTAPYAQQYEQRFREDTSGIPNAAGAIAGIDPTASSYVATGTFNRFTGRWQAAYLGPENVNDENKSRRQMQAFFDVDAAANSHNGRSLKAERSAKKLSKKELKAFKDKRRDKKEQKRRAWLRD